MHPCWEDESATPRKLLTPALIAGIRRQGMGIVVWNEDRPAELRELIKLNVDGICTDAPDVLAEILNAKCET